MSKHPDSAPLATVISPVRKTADPRRFDCARNITNKLAPGQTLSGRYRIERVVGEGGMGVVYLATDEQIAGETFAVKVLKDALHPTVLALLREEVHQTRRLSHPNIVDVHSVNVDGTKLYVLMEYLEGKSLHALLHEEFGRGMPLSHAWPIIEDTAAALGYAHDHNVVHSDLKPANIFVTHSGRTKLLDFGIARISRSPLLHQYSETLALTPAYASCEMLEGKEADPRDDVYSFACVIYEMLSGRRPFDDLTAQQAREHDARAPAIEALSRQQNAALGRALALHRDARTPSVEKLLHELAAPKARPRLVAAITLATAAAIGLSYWALGKLLTPTPTHATVMVTGTAPFNPPTHSVAVLPLVNIGDKEQDYFSDGLTEELLNSLSRINELQVAARTSSFSFQGQHPDITTVAHKLNVSSVLEGSVRRSGNTIRVTVELNNALTGFHLWSQSYDRSVGDVLVLQTEIADSVASALKVTLLGNVAARVEMGGTHNAAAFDAYLRGLKATNMVHDARDDEAAIAAYAEAIRLDPGYSLALSAHSLMLTDYADFYATGPAIHESYERAKSDARRAIERTPFLANGHLAFAKVLASESLNFAQAADEYQRAVSLAPGNAQVAYEYGFFSALMGHTDDGFAAIRHAIELDPLNPRPHRLASFALRMLGRYPEAVQAAQSALALDAHNPGVLTTLGMAYYALGEYEEARATCERTESPASTPGSYFGIQLCLAIAYERLGRHSDAQSMLQILQSWYGDRGAYQYAQIYSQWGNAPEALTWLETAIRLDDSGLAWLKVDPLMDSLRNQPRFQVVQAALKFPP